MKMFLGRIWNLFHHHAAADSEVAAHPGEHRTLGVYSILCSLDKKSDAGH